MNKNENRNNGTEKKKMAAVRKGHRKERGKSTMNWNQQTYLLSKDS